MIERTIHTFTVREKPTYVAGPLSDPNTATQIWNVGVASVVALDLIRAGHLVYLPHLCQYLEYQQNGSLGWQFWMDYDLEWLRRCGRVVRIPGESKGADIEVDTALAIGMRVYWWDDAEDWRELMTMYADPALPGEQLAAASGALQG